MSIYTSDRVLPYVYICTNRLTGEFYIGSRTSRKQTTPSHVDFPLYRTSSKKVKPIFDQFDWYIVAEFFEGQDAYDFEQLLIFDHWGQPLCLNKFYTMGGKRMWGCDNFGRRHPNRKSSRGWQRKTPMTDEHKRKISEAKKGKETGPNPLKALTGEKNGMYGKSHTDDSIDKIRMSRSQRTAEQNAESYSRIKSEDERLKLSSRHIAKVCRIKDRKEMSAANFLKYLKSKPHLF